MKAHFKEIYTTMNRSSGRKKIYSNEKCDTFGATLAKIVSTDNSINVY